MAVVRETGCVQEWLRRPTLMSAGICLFVCQLLEEASAENARVEQEVIILRNKVYGVNRPTASTPLTVIYFSF